MISNSQQVIVPLRETPDVDSATESYAARFAGKIGRYLLDVQTQATLELLKPWPGASVLDVGGGHAQVAAPLSEAGYQVTVLASDERGCRRPRQLLGNKVQLAVGDLAQPPFAARSFDLAVSFRILPHLSDWKTLIGSMCRIARYAVVVDFPIPGGFNSLAPLLFGVKKQLEGNTRTFNVMAKDQVRQVFSSHGFGQYVEHGQFFLPMVLHRTIKQPAFSRAAESLCRTLGLTARWGSPVILRAAPGHGAEGPSQPDR